MYVYFNVDDVIVVDFCFYYIMYIFMNKILCFNI